MYDQNIPDTTTQTLEALNNLSKDLEILKLKDINDIKTAIKILNGKIDKIVEIQDKTIKEMEKLKPNPANILATLELHSKTTGEITKALADTMKEEFELFTSGKGNRGNYSKLEDLVAAFEGPLANHGLKVIFSPWETETGESLIIGTLRHDSGEFFNSISKVIFDENIGKQSGDNQAIASGKTYAKREAYSALLGI